MSRCLVTYDIKHYIIASVPCHVQCDSRNTLWYFVPWFLLMVFFCGIIEILCRHTLQLPGRVLSSMGIGQFIIAKGWLVKISKDGHNIKPMVALMGTGWFGWQTQEVAPSAFQWHRQYWWGWWWEYVVIITQCTMDDYDCTGCTKRSNFDISHVFGGHGIVYCHWCY